MFKLILAFLLLISSFLQAQVGQTTFEWDHSSQINETLTYTHKMSIDGIDMDMSNTTCFANKLTPNGEEGSTCRVTVPALKSGEHLVILSATVNGMTTSGTFKGFNPDIKPTTPTGARIVVTVSVQVK